MSGNRRERPKELLNEHDTRELVRQRQRAERETLICSPGDLWIKTHGTPDQKDRRTGVVKAHGAPRREGLT